MTLKFDIASDLHVDAWYQTTQPYDPNGPKRWTGENWGEGKYLHIDWKWHKNPDSRVLVIAGDISNKLLDTIDIVKDASMVYEYVVFVEGNHDHYQSSIEANVDDNQTILRDSLRLFQNFIYLDGQRSINIDGTLFVGVLGWYDWKAFEDRGIPAEVAKNHWHKGSGDSERPNYGPHNHPGILAFQHAELLRAQVLEAQNDPTVERIVAVTHTSPRAELNAWVEGADNWNLLTPSYINTQMQKVLDVDVLGKLSHWVYGHTHDRKVITLDGVTYVNNARGYPRENEWWSLLQMTARSRYEEENQHTKK